MPKEFIGYRISPRWTRLTLWRFNAKTHARESIEEITPFRHFNKEQRRQTILERLQGLNIPTPPPCFEPK